MKNNNQCCKGSLRDFLYQKKQVVKKGLLENLKDGILKNLKKLKELIQLNPC